MHLALKNQVANLVNWKKLGFNKTTLVRVLASLLKTGVLELDDQAKDIGSLLLFYKIDRIPQL